MSVLIISDLHLTPERPDTTRCFFDFIEKHAISANCLYILGDLFEYWIGDDAADQFAQTVIEKLNWLSGQGVKLFYMHGNRDFLIGEQFSINSKCQLIDDPVVIDLFGRRMLLMHGDTLCTDDTDYQEFRLFVRDQQWQSTFLSYSIEKRIAIAKQYRNESQQSSEKKSYEIMDIAQNTAELKMREYNVDLLIHGHTHRPNIHRFDLAGRQMTRIVLGSWDPNGKSLRIDKDSIDLFDP